MTRFVFHHFLALRKSAWETEQKTVTRFACDKMLPQLKQDYPWLAEADSTALQAAVEPVDVAYPKFFKEKTGYPRFKSKRHNEQSYTTKNVGKTIRIEDNTVRLPKIGLITVAKSRDVASGKWVVSILAAMAVPAPLEPNDQWMGIAVGLKAFATLNTGEQFLAPKPLCQALEQLAKAQRKRARRKKAVKIEQRHGFRWLGSMSASAVSVVIFCTSSQPRNPRDRLGRFACSEHDAQSSLGVRDWRRGLGRISPSVGIQGHVVRTTGDRCGQPIPV